MSKGKIVQVIGPVVDVEFPDHLPAIYNALTLEFDVPGQARAKLTLEVEHFFSVYKDLEHKVVEVDGWHSLADARETIARARERELELERAAGNI